MITAAVKVAAPDVPVTAQAKEAAAALRRMHKRSDNSWSMLIPNIKYTVFPKHGARTSIETTDEAASANAEQVATASRAEVIIVLLDIGSAS